ncbi:hypothetical protein L6164_013118 [Bauhinia variegata]|uniref:Uncharacterized protein n=1 Tax=Bauhinia variegata TaxID=167791 RepID=A0ACB9PC30_BAUVA|nr:hypothetical protein L6164_013118 [Bauhinia variegata]
MAYVSAPCLILPNMQNQDQDQDHKTSTGGSVMNLSQKKLYESKNRLKGLVDDAWCVGSSEGFLVSLDQDGEPLLVDPFSSTRIKLPSFPSIIGQSHFFKEMSKIFISKAVMLCDSVHFTRYCRFSIVIIYGSQDKLVFCQSLNKIWIELPGAERSYCDIIFSRGTLFALSNNGSVEGWDFSGKKPVKFFDIDPCAEICGEEIRNFPEDEYTVRLYLVESLGELLLVKRFIEDFVNPDGEVLKRDDNVKVEVSKDSYSLDFPYRTKHFSLYKLDMEYRVGREKVLWRKIESLNDQVLFLGRNESASVSAQAFPQCEANSIYFTDDGCNEMYENDLYGGHDVGVFSVQDRSITPLIPYKMIYPPPFWVVPTLRN